MLEGWEIAVLRAIEPGGVLDVFCAHFLYRPLISEAWTASFEDQTPGRGEQH